jgi:hypothetical protein
LEKSQGGRKEPFTRGAWEKKPQKWFKVERDIECVELLLANGGRMETTDDGPTIVWIALCWQLQGRNGRFLATK